MKSTTRHQVLMSGVRCGITILVSCALIAPAAAQSAQQSDKKARQQTTQQMKTVGSSIIVDSEDIVRNPGKYYGKTVMIQPADVNTVINQHAFMLDEDALLAGPDILVLVPHPAGDVLNKDAEVRVTGTVRPYVVSEIKRDFDWFDENGIEIDFTDRPVIVAESVTSSDGREWAGVITRQHEPQRTGAERDRQQTLTAGAIAENPERYVGQRVTVRAEIEDIYNPQLFTLDEDRWFVGPDVIVYARDGRTSLREDQDDQIVTVTGEVRKFIESELFSTATWFDPWFRDLDETGRGLVRSRPVIIAESVTTASGAQLYTANTTRTEADTAVAARGTTSQQPHQPERQARTRGATGTTGSAAASRAREFAIGNRVTATGTIQRMATDRAFWLDLEGHHQPIMVIVDASKLAEMTGDWKPGVNQRVTVSGTVKEVPGTEGRGTVTEWGLEPEDMKRLEMQRMYIHADSIDRQR